MKMFKFGQKLDERRRQLGDKTKNQFKTYTFHKKYGPYHSDGGGAAVKLPVERQPSKLALQLQADVAVLLPRQGNLGLAISWSLTAQQARPSHLAQVGEERSDRRSQTLVQLLGGGQ